MRVLVTGGYGFVGRYLSQYLVSCGDDVVCAYYPKEKPDPDGKDELGIPMPNSAQSVGLDITDRAAVDQLVAVLRPEAIYHLAAITFIPDAESNAARVFEVNTFGSMNLMEATMKHCPQSLFLMVSTAEVYGDPRVGTLPLTELAVMRPVNNYGLSKAAADLAAFKYSFQGLNAIRMRPFPHFGPGQSPQFALSSFAKQLAEIKLGRIEPKIKVGNLEAKRDYSDVSDIVRGYRDGLLNGKRGEAYNLCSGVSTSMSDLLQKLIKVAEVEVEVVVDPDRLRPVDIPELVGSSAKAQKDFGWKPRIDPEASLHSLFAYWLERMERAPQ